jgi:hypothetical protein
MKSPPTEEVYITWNDSRRSQSLCTYLGLRRVVFVSEWKGVLRHLWGTLRTALFLLDNRPKLIWYQFSLLLGVTIATYTRIVGRQNVRVVVDMHHKALRREGHSLVKPIVLCLKHWALSVCQCALVPHPTDASFAKSRLRTASMVLPDPLPIASCSGSLSTEAGPVDVLFICSFGVDEPIDLIAEVCRRLSPMLTVGVTGDFTRRGTGVLNELRRLVRVTGYLGEVEYWGTLRQARCVVDLSLDSASLPCGAYEAIALGRRPVLNLDEGVAGFFGDLASYSLLNPNELERAILEAVKQAPPEGDMALAVAYQKLWEERWKPVQEVLARCDCLPESRRITPSVPYLARQTGPSP